MDNDKICGVERNVIEKILVLIRDKYECAEEAFYFLSSEAGYTSKETDDNARNIISHLITILDSNSTYEERLSALECAEECIRKTIIEPYKEVANYQVTGVNNLLSIYKKTVLPSLNNGLLLKSPINLVSIDSKIKRAKKILAQGTKATGKSRWNEESEEGIKAFVEAVEILAKIKKSLEEAIYCHKNWEKENQRNKKKKKRHVIWSIAAMVLAIIGIICTIIFSDSGKQIITYAREKLEKVGLIPTPLKETMKKSDEVAVPPSK